MFCFSKLISQRRGAVSSYYHFDALGSTHELTTDDETTSDTYLYDAFGKTLSASGSTLSPFRYVGQEGYYFDEDTDHLYVRARTYDPATGRWISRDPIGFDSGDVNLSRYVGNRAVNRVDPSGHQQKPARLTPEAYRELDRVWWETYYDEIDNYNTPRHIARRIANAARARRLREMEDDYWRVRGGPPEDKKPGRMVKPERGCEPTAEELITQLRQIVLDIIGIFDPTPCSDGLGFVNAVGSGDLYSAGISLIALFPYIGDAAKLAKLNRYIDTITEMIQLARRSERYAAIVGPFLKFIRRQLNDAADVIKILPEPLRTSLEKLRRNLDDFFADANRIHPPAIDDISRSGDNLRDAMRRGGDDAIDEAAHNADTIRDAQRRRRKAEQKFRRGECP